MIFNQKTSRRWKQNMMIIQGIGMLPLDGMRKKPLFRWIQYWEQLQILKKFNYTTYGLRHKSFIEIDFSANPLPDKLFGYRFNVS